MFTPFGDDLSPDEVKAKLREVDPQLLSFIASGMTMSTFLGIELSHPFGVDGPITDPAVLCTIDDPVDKNHIVMVICNPNGTLGLGIHAAADVEEFRAFIRPLMGPTWFESAMADRENPWGRHQQALNHGLVANEDKEVEQYGVALPSWLNELANVAD